MSTFPFVQVEGALSLPHIRPLTPLPASFGREWALTDPQFSLRAELRALYAAIMRTVCMSVEAFRAAARWDHHRSPVQPDPTPAAAVSAPVAPVVASAAAAAHMRPAQARGTSGASAPRTPPFERSKLAGGAVAIGGAALLTWLVASHTPNDAAPSPDKANPHTDAPAHQDTSQRLAEARAQHDEHTTGGASQQRVAHAPVSVPTPPTVSPRTANATPAEAVAPRTAGAPALATVQTQAQTPVPAPVAAAVNAGKTPQVANPARSRPDFGEQTHAKAASPARLAHRDARSNGSAVKRDASQRVAKASAKSSAKLHRDVHEFAPYREARPVTTHRTHAAYSEARVYSPRQTGANPTDEYSAILTYANTYSAARTSNRPTVPVDSTDWVNHVSQRRVTEVPDRFAK
jgi:hypothetical protein